MKRLRGFHRYRCYEIAQNEVYEASAKLIKKKKTGVLQKLKIISCQLMRVWHILYLVLAYYLYNAEKPHWRKSEKNCTLLSHSLWNFPNSTYLADTYSSLTDPIPVFTTASANLKRISVHMYQPPTPGNSLPPLPLRFSGRRLVLSWVMTERGHLNQPCMPHEIPTSASLNTWVKKNTSSPASSRFRAYYCSQIRTHWRSRTEYKLKKKRLRASPLEHEAKKKRIKASWLRHSNFNNCHYLCPSNYRHSRTEPMRAAIIIL